MKKTLIMLLILVLLVSVVACDKKTDAKDKKEEKKTAAKKEEKKKPEDKEYGLNEWWEVKGEWKLKIDEVTVTSERNKYSAKKPKQVVIVKYSYENTEAKKDVYLYPKTVVDAKKKVAYEYPAVIKGMTRPKALPTGTSIDGAMKVYGLENESDKITIYFERYSTGEKPEKFRAKFVVPVKK